MNCQQNQTISSKVTTDEKGYFSIYLPKKVQFTKRGLHVEKLDGEERVFMVSISYKIEKMPLEKTAMQIVASPDEENVFILKLA